MVVGVLDKILRQLIIVLSEIDTEVSLVLEVFENATSRQTVQSTLLMCGTCTYDDMMSFCQASRASTRE